MLAPPKGHFSAACCLFAIAGVDPVPAGHLSSPSCCLPSVRICWGWSQTPLPYGHFSAAYRLFAVAGDNTRPVSAKGQMWPNGTQNSLRWPTASPLPHHHHPQRVRTSRRHPSTTPFGPCGPARTHHLPLDAGIPSACEQAAGAQTHPPGVPQRVRDTPGSCRPVLGAPQLTRSSRLTRPADAHANPGGVRP